FVMLLIVDAETPSSVESSLHVMPRSRRCASTASNSACGSNSILGILTAARGMADQREDHASEVDAPAAPAISLRSTSLPNMKTFAFAALVLIVDVPIAVHAQARRPQY